MASLVLGAIGGYFFGPIGFMVGSALGNMLDPEKKEGPRLKNLHLQGSEYGKMIPIVYGANAAAPNVIWQTDLEEHEHTSGGKGGPEVTTYTYTVSFATLVCEGPVTSVPRIWADGTLIRDINGDSGNFPELPLTIYYGTDTQLPDPTMEAVLGVGWVPANRGYCYLVFTDWDVGTFGNRIPNLKVEVLTHSRPDEAAHIVKANHEEPYDGGAASPWGFRWTEGPVGTGHPAILHWDMSGDIRVQMLNGNLGFVYRQSDYQFVENVSLATSEMWGVHSDLALGNVYWPVGIYRYADGSTTPLWQWIGLHFVGGGQTQNAAVAAGGAGIGYPDETPASESNFALNAGLDAGHGVVSVVLSNDGRHCYIFTSGDLLDGQAREWFDIVDGVIARQGTVSPSLNGASALGYGSTSPIGGFVSSVFEDEGEYCWSLSTNQGSGPTPFVVGGLVKAWKIDGGGNFAAASGVGTASAEDPGADRTGFTPDWASAFSGAICSPATGYAGVVIGRSLVLFSRFGDDEEPLLLSEIVGDLSDRSGLEGGQYDVSALTDEVEGFIIDRQTSARDCITPLQTAFFFDGVESGGQMVFVKRGGRSAVTIANDELAAHPDGGELPAILATKRAEESQLPATLNISYMSRALDYQVSTQYARRLVTNSLAVSTANLPIVMTDDRAKAVAEINLTDAWISRETFTFTTRRKYWAYEPTDVFTAGGRMLRAMRKSDAAGGVVQFEGPATNPMIWLQGPVAVAALGIASVSSSASVGTELQLLNIPLVDDADSQFGFYAAMGPSTEGTWRGATLYRSTDGGGTYVEVASVSAPAIMGTVTEALGDYTGSNTFDEGNVIRVELNSGGGTLAGADELSVLNGANTALVGDEIVRFKYAELVSDGVGSPVGGVVYQLSGLLRGRRGTEWAIPGHYAGERFILLPVTNVAGTQAELGTERLYKAVSRGASIGSATAVAFTNTGVGARPYAPVHVSGGPVTPFDGTVQINWTRRTRVGGEWTDYVDVPLSEATEAYVVQIWDSTFTTVARSVEVTTTSYEYGAAQQISDFGAIQQTIFCTVGQKGAYLLGTQARGDIPGLGASNGAASAPIPPYNSAPPPTSGGCTLPITSSTFDWNAPVSQYNSAAGPIGTWVLSFTTGPTALPGVGRIDAYEYGGPPVQRTVTLALSPCGAPLAPAARQVGTTVSLFFYMTANPYPATYPTLLPNTTYYVSIDSIASSGMICNLITPT